MSNKTYRLLKDLPFAKAGEIFESRISDDGEEYLFWGEIKTEKIENFDEWFEEIKEFEIPDEFDTGFWTIDFEGYFFGSGGAYPRYITDEHWGEAHYKNNLKCYTEMNWAFATKEEAEKHIEWLKARAILIQDTKGFKPDWTDFNQMKYHVQYDYEDCEFGVWSGSFNKYCEIYFATEEDANQSIKTHEKEWKTYLSVEEQQFNNLFHLTPLFGRTVNNRV